VFARSETVLQLSWVIGGGCGIVMPLIPRLGFGFLAAILIAVVLIVLRYQPTPRAAAPRTAGPRPAAPSPSGGPAFSEPRSRRTTATDPTAEPPTAGRWWSGQTPEDEEETVEDLAPGHWAVEPTVERRPGALGRRRPGPDPGSDRRPPR
jgi:hypothetical protein